MILPSNSAQRRGSASSKDFWAQGLAGGMPYGRRNTQSLRRYDVTGYFLHLRMLTYQRLMSV